MMDADGSNRRQITSDGTGIDGFLFSPDQKKSDDDTPHKVGAHRAGRLS